MSENLELSEKMAKIDKIQELLNQAVNECMEFKINDHNNIDLSREDAYLACINVLADKFDEYRETLSGNCKNIVNEWVTVYKMCLKEREPIIMKKLIKITENYK